MGPLRERLRVETRAAHDRVDAAFSRFDLLDREGYGAFLLAHAKALPALETALDEAGAASIVADWPERRRTPALEADLKGLGLRRPERRPVPKLGGAAEALGALYVLEGSRLGARLLLGRVRASSDPDVRGAVAYLSHGEAHRFWPSFLLALERRPYEPAVVDGALAAFALFGRAAGMEPVAGSTLSSAAERSSTANGF